MSDRGELFVLSAPSGGGKTTLVRRLLERHRELAESVRYSVSHTTRPPRRGEVDGRDYHFVDRREFERMVAEGLFLEWAEVHGNAYGTSRAAVEELLARGSDVILDIDVEGARQIGHQHPEAATVFILPPGPEALAERLYGRGLDDPAVIERRLAAAVEEMRQVGRYKYVILNDDLDRASEELAAVFLARRLRRPRMQSAIERVLARFSSPSGSAITEFETRASEKRQEIDRR